MQAIKMHDAQSISTLRLILRKTQGCYREFGMMEILRRFVRESLRAMSKSNHFLDISFVIEEFGIGAAPTSIDAVKYLKKQGFEYLIDLRAERAETDILANTHDITVRWIPTHDDWRPKSREFFTTLEEAIKEILVSRDGARFLLCCVAGEHRAPLAGVLALVIMGYPLEQAVEMIEMARPVAELLPPYHSSLVEFIHAKPAHPETGWPTRIPLPR